MGSFLAGQVAVVRTGTEKSMVSLILINHPIYYLQQFARMDIV